MTVPHQGLICPDCGVAGTYSGNGPHGHRYECPTPDCQTIAYYTDQPPMVFTPAELRRLDRVQESVRINDSLAALRALLFATPDLATTRAHINGVEFSGAELRRLCFARTLYLAGRIDQ